MKSKNIIFLIGFSCSGKSTIGPKLSFKLRMPFYDIDKIIEKKEKRPISDIFESDGEKYFRQLEKDTTFSVAENRSKSKIISLGGGGFENKEIRKLVKDIGMAVYLRCSQKELYRRISQKTDRPLLISKPGKNKTTADALKYKIKTMLDKRENNYNKADIIVSTTDKNIKLTMSEITIKLKKFHGTD